MPRILHEFDTFYLLIVYNAAVPEWIGKVVGKVRIDQLLAHGGMAEVYLGTHLTLGRPVAIKVLHSYIEEEPDLRERFEREAKVVAGFRHPNIVQVYDFDTIEGHPYIAMEYLDGPTLGVLLQDLHARKQRLTPEQVTEVLKGPAAALDYAHARGVIHRDVKPGNIMLHRIPRETTALDVTNADLDAIVTDFGLLRMTGATLQTSYGTIAGTPNYMSPEQASGTTVDYRTDIYSLGVVLYEMLAGRAPFDGDTTMTVLYKQIHEPPPPIPGISPQEQAVLDKALSKNPADRYQSCGKLAEAYAAAIAEQPAEETVRRPVPPTITTTELPAEETVRRPAPSTVPSAVPESRPLPSTVTAVAVDKPPHNPAPKKRSWFLPAAIASAAVVVLGVGALVFLPKLGAIEAATPRTQATGTSAANAATAVNTLPSGANMVKIAAGTYQLGVSAADEFHAAQQAVSLPQYWIDQYPVTNEQYQQFMHSGNVQQPLVWPGEPHQPVRGVTWDQAGAYCASVQKRLPSEAEWEAAGRGSASDPQLYPWGNDPTDGGKALQMPDQDTYEVGSLPFNVSASGVYDLVGEVWQWVNQAYAQTQGGYLVLRGGRFGLPQDLAYRLVVAPDDSRYVKFTGFRCAAENVK